MAACRFAQFPLRARANHVKADGGDDRRARLVEALVPHGDDAAVRFALGAPDLNHLDARAQPVAEPQRLPPFDRPHTGRADDRRIPKMEVEEQAEGEAKRMEGRSDEAAEVDLSRIEALGIAADIGLAQFRFRRLENLSCLEILEEAACHDQTRWP